MFGTQLHGIYHCVSFHFHVPPMSLFQEVADKGDIDSVVVTMKFPSGVIGILDFCRYSCYGYDIRLEVKVTL